MNFCDMLFNFSNNMYMLWSHLSNVTLFSNDINMLVTYLLYVTQFVNNVYMVFVVPDICCSKNLSSYTMLLCYLQYAWTHVIAWHGIQLDSVQWDHRSPMVSGYHDHVSTASSQRDWVSQSTLSHGNLANRRGRPGSYCRSPFSETRHVRQLFTKEHTILIHVRQHVSTFLFLFFYPATEVRKNQRGC